MTTSTEQAQQGENPEVHDLRLVQYFGEAMLDNDLAGAWRAGENLLGVNNGPLTNEEIGAGVETQIAPSRYAVYDNRGQRDPITANEHATQIQDPRERQVVSLASAQSALRFGPGVQRAYRRNDSNSTGPTAGIAVIDADLREHVYTAPSYTADSEPYGPSELGTVLEGRGYQRAYINQSPLLRWASRNPGPAADTLIHLLTADPRELVDHQAELLAEPAIEHRAQPQHDVVAETGTAILPAIGGRGEPSAAAQHAGLAALTIGAQPKLSYTATNVELTDPSGRVLRLPVNQDLAATSEPLAQREGGRHRGQPVDEHELLLTREPAATTSSNDQQRPHPLIQRPPQDARGLIPETAVARWRAAQAARDTGEITSDGADAAAAVVAAAERVVSGVQNGAGDQDKQLLADLGTGGGTTAAGLERRVIGASGRPRPKRRQPRLSAADRARIAGFIAAQNNRSNS